MTFYDFVKSLIDIGSLGGSLSRQDVGGPTGFMQQNQILLFCRRIAHF